MRGGKTTGRSPLGLLELVAGGAIAVGSKIIQAILKVGPQIKTGAQRPDVGLALCASPAQGPLPGKAVTKSLAAGGRIQRTKTIKLAAFNRPLGDLVD